MLKRELLASASAQGGLNGLGQVGTGMKRSTSKIRLSSGAAEQGMSSEMAKLIPSKRQQRNDGGLQSLEKRVVICMVGLPARGKSYIVKMIVRYLSWMGYSSKLFNVGELRRTLKMGGKSLAGIDASFFKADNKEGRRVREQMAVMVQDLLYEWLLSPEPQHAADGQGKRSMPRVAIFDATNTTRARRATLLARAARHPEVKLMFIESICTDEEILRRNYALKLQNADYKDMDHDEALRDFTERVKAYEAVYEPVSDDEYEGRIAYIKLYNVGQKVTCRNCDGYLPSSISLYLQNVHITPRKIWLTLHSESIDQKAGILGRDSGNLTDGGRLYSMYLSKFVNRRMENLDLENAGRDIIVMAGTSQLHGETISHLQIHYVTTRTPLLRELGGGDYTGVGRAQLPDDLLEERERDKLHFRYPGLGGESYWDVIQRVQPLIVELERQRRSVVIVGHLAVLRCLYGYFMAGKETLMVDGTKRNLEMEDIPYINLNFHTVYELTPGPFGTEAQTFSPDQGCDYS